MRIVLADPAPTDGFVRKGAVASGDGPGLRPISPVTRIIRPLERRTPATASLQPGCAAAGRSILFTPSPISVRRARPTRATASGVAAC
jgi:hypothetical protein